MILLNSTPHAISVHRAGKIDVIEPSGRPARVRSSMAAARVEGLDFEILDQGPDLEIVNLPPSQPGAYVIVSQIVALVAARQYPHRRDILFPATSKYQGATKDANGVVSVRSFIRAS